MKLLINSLVFVCILFYACTQEKPEITGEWKHTFNPNNTRWEEDAIWYTNDHCFVEDKEENLHCGSESIIHIRQKGKNYTAIILIWGI